YLVYDQYYVLETLIIFNSISSLLYIVIILSCGKINDNKSRCKNMARQYDFTKGNISKQLILFSWPILLANLLQTSYQVVDSLWIGNLLGAKSLGAVAISGAIIFTLLSFIIGLNNAALTILSQQKGRKDESGLKSYLNAFVFILIL